MPSIPMFSSITSRFFDEKTIRYSHLGEFDPEEEWRSNFPYAFIQPDMPDIMTVEEVENGLHASRIQLLLELFRTQAEVTRTQVFATTHSPVILDWLQEEDYKTTFLCTRDESTGESRIQPVADIPHLMDVIKETPASELLSEGWFEALP